MTNKKSKKEKISDDAPAPDTEQKIEPTPAPAPPADDAPAPSAADILKTKPTPAIIAGITEKIGAPEQGIAEKGSTANDGATDTTGEKFDPTIHLSRDGKPVYTSKGAFRKKKNTGVVVDGVPDGDEQKAAASRRICAELSAGSFIQIGVAIFGDEWQPEIDGGVNEQANLTAIFENYYRAKGVTDIPVGAALAIGLSAYALKRFSRPTTKTRLQEFFVWTRNKVGGFFSMIRGTKKAAFDVKKK